MPELPEVETMRRDLQGALGDARIARVRVRKPDIVLGGRSARSFAARLRGAHIRAVERRGKNLAFRLRTRDGSPAVLQVQVRMTGRFAVAGPEDPDGRRLAEALGFSHVAALFALDGGRTLLYDDVRRLGGFRLLSERAWAEGTARLGPEPLEAGFTARELGRLLGRGRAPVKNALMDQGRVAGVGNIYASEALHRAGIDPRRSCAGLDPADVGRLHRSLRAVLREALRAAGTSLRNYEAVNGRSGEFQTRLRVYGREGERCRRCAGTVARIVQAGRSSFFCPGCQS